MLRRRNGRHFLEGAFSLNGEYYHISLDSNFRRARLLDGVSLPDTSSPYMVVWKEVEAMGHADDSLLVQRSVSNASDCGVVPSELDGRDENDHFRRQTLGGFDPVDVIGSTEGCPTSRRVALLGIATDCTYTAQFDSVQDARENIISMINVASQVYEDTFNIGLAIRNLTISDSSCPSTPPSSTAWNLACTANTDISGRLNLFSQWRGRLRDDNAVWTLLSSCRSGSTVGMAWIGSLCSRGGQRGWRGGGFSAGTNVVVRTEGEWQVFAHELAHNFGAYHDCTSSSCGSSGPSEQCCPLSRSTCDANNRYLMNPSSSPWLEDFSPCTIGTICTAMGENIVDASCLVSEDSIPDINDSQCGNGIVEPGEACDCGGPGGCPEDSCCNPSTCQLRSGAACDPGTDACCTDQCQVAPSGQVCRASTGLCDPEETCDGSSSQCPDDVQECGDDDDNNGGGGFGGGGGSGDSWFDNNRTAIIATSASVGGVIVILIAFCIITSCIRKRRRRSVANRLQRMNPPTGLRAPFPQTNTGGMTQLPAPPRMVYRYA